MKLEKLSDEFYEYEPGNGTRYFILVTRIKPAGHIDSTLAFMWLKHGDRGGMGMVIDPDEMIDLEYFLEKTGITNQHDAVALLCFLGEEFRCRVGGIPMHFRTYSWFRQAEERGAV